MLRKLIIKGVILAFSYILFNAPLLAADEEMKTAEKRSASSDSTLSASQLLFIAKIQDIINALNPIENPMQPKLDFSQRIESAKKLLIQYYYDHLLPDEKITGDVNFFLKIVHQDFATHDQGEAIRIVTNKLEQLIERIKSISIEKQKVEKKARREEPRPSTHSSQQAPMLQQPTAKKTTVSSTVPVPHVHSQEHGHEMESPYQLVSQGPEERWRWRSSFHFSYSLTPESKPFIMDFTQLHKNLTKIKNGIEKLDTGFFSTDNNNVIVPAITIIYENNDGHLTHETGFIPDIKPTGIRKANQKIVFLSGMGGGKFPANYVEMDQEFQITMGVISSAEVMIEKLLMAYNIPEGIHDTSLDVFRDHTLNLIKHKKYDGRDTNFGTYFYHSEQWLIAYLLLDYFRQPKIVQYGNLCKAIAFILEPKKDHVKRIHQIIFHIASKHDICDICSPTLTVFLEQLDRDKAKIIEVLEARLPNDLKGRNIISPNLGFFMITSSDRADINQAKLRSFYIESAKYYAGDRRNNFGRDRSLDSPTIIAHDTPYKYVQVAVNREGDPIRLK